MAVYRVSLPGPGAELEAPPPSTTQKTQAASTARVKLAQNLIFTKCTTCEEIIICLVVQVIILSFRCVFRWQFLHFILVYFIHIPTIYESDSTFYCSLQWQANGWANNARSLNWLN